MTTHVETSKQGITIDKSLAWTMVVGLISAGIYLGSEMRHSRTQLEGVMMQLNEMKLTSTQFRSEQVRAAAELDGRLRVVETMRASDSTELNAIRREMTDLKTDIRVLSTDLREALQIIKEGVPKR